MPWNGSGTYSPPVASFPEVNGTIIDAGRYNPTINDLATGITAALAKNGENSPTANLPMAGYRHTGLGDGAATGQAIVFGQATASHVLGNFGVGVTPTQRLHALLTQNANTRIRVENASGGAAAQATLDAQADIARGFLRSNSSGHTRPNRVEVGSDTSHRVDLMVGGVTAVSIDTSLQVSVTATTASTSTATGALLVAGGVGVGGAVVTGASVSIHSAASDNYFISRANAGFNRGLLLQTGTLNRWLLRVNSTAESGSNAGSDLVIVTYDDTGAFLRNALVINRATGAWSVTGALTATSLAGTGSGITALNASNLTSGTVPSARISGAYTGFSSITASGTITAATFSGNGASLTSLNAANLASGTVPTARLGSGTANSTTFLRGDNTWQPISGSGTVTSVNVAGSNGIGVSGGPITTSGTITLSLGAITPSSVNTAGSVTASSLVGPLTGNASTATTLQTARLIGGVSFNGSANIDLPGVNIPGTQNTTGSAATLTTPRSIRTDLASGSAVNFDGSANITPGVTGVLATSNGGTGVTGAVNSSSGVLAGLATTANNILVANGAVWQSVAPPTWNQNTTGSAATLTVARTINGTAFNGSANITTASWGTARTLTLGASGKSVDGSINVSWSLAEIGALSATYINVPRNTTSGGEDGGCTATSAGFTLNTGLAAGTTRSFYNNSASDIVITQGSGLTLRRSGTNITGNQTLLARGMVTVWANSTTEYIVSGDLA